MKQATEVLSTESITAVMEALKAKGLEDVTVVIQEKGEKLITDDGQMIPKHRLDEVISQRDTFKAQADQFDKDLKALKASAKGNEELTAQIEALQEANKQAKAEAEATVLKNKKTFAVKEALLNAGVGDAAARDLLAKNFDIDSIELYAADGKVKGFDDLLKPIKENKAFAGMFGEMKIAGQGHDNGDSPLAGKNPWSKSTRNLEQQIKITRENPEQAKKLKEAAILT